jgi:hypothetical protein
MGFTIGDTVKVVSGPLKGSVGEITSVSGNLALEVLVAKSPVRAFEGSKTFFRIDQLKVQSSRKSASEVIRSLEMRIARLERQAAENHLKSADIVKYLGQLGIKLPLWEEAKGMSLKERMDLSKKVGHALGDNWSAFLLRHGEIVISGVDVLPAKKPDADWWAGLICSKTGKFIAADKWFQKAFIRGFEDSEWINDYNLGVAEEAANYDVPASRYIHADKLAKGIKFNVRGTDLVISIKR